MIKPKNLKKLLIISLIILIALGLIIAANNFRMSHNSKDINTELENLRVRISQECDKKGFAEDCDEGLNAVGEVQLHKNADLASKQNDSLIITLENGEKKIFQDKSADPQDETDVGTYYIYDYFFRDLGFYAIRENTGGCSSGDTMLVNSKTGETTPISSHYYYWQFSPDNKNFLVYTCGGKQIWEISPNKLKLKYEDHNKDCENELMKAKWVNNHKIEFTNSTNTGGKSKRNMILLLDGDVWRRIEGDIL